MDIFAKLNDKQLLAVKNTEGFVRVIAGAGSGKTKLLVSRYAYLVKEYGILLRKIAFKNIYKRNFNVIFGNVVCHKISLQFDKCPFPCYFVIDRSY